MGSKKQAKAHKSKQLEIPTLPTTSMMFINAKYLALFFLASTIFILSIDNKHQAESKSLRFKQIFLQCKGRTQKICNHLGAFCHADVLTFRRKRSTNSGSHNRRRMSKHFMRKLNRCDVCHQVCWS